MNKIESRKRRGLRTKYVIRQSNRPRLLVFRSGQHIYAQIIVFNGLSSQVLVSSSTVDKEVKVALTGNKSDQARHVGRVLAERAKVKEISDVAFDRAGFRYHGRVRALADAAREAGLNF
jgi:large subunit ribosomal protein L18